MHVQSGMIDPPYSHAFGTDLPVISSMYLTGKFVFANVKGKIDFSYPKVLGYNYELQVCQ